MEVVLSPDAKEDLRYWRKISETAVLRRIKYLIQAIQDNPFHGVGKPEPLKHHLSGLWSRRINSVHRIVYEIKDNKIYILSLRWHY